MSATRERYVPAAGRAAFTRVFDPVMAVTMRESAWRPVVVDEVTASLPTGGIVMDVGAGTGTLAIAVADARPDAVVVAVDGDPDALQLAREKQGAKLVDWREGLAEKLPSPDGRVDAVLMSLVLHHLGASAKRAALAEALRVLRPTGSLFIADWGRPRGVVPRAGFFSVRLLDGFDRTREHAAGSLPALVREVGFLEPRLRKRLATVWGTLEVFAAQQP